MKNKKNIPNPTGLSTQVDNKTKLLARDLKKIVIISLIILVVLIALVAVNSKTKFLLDLTEKIMGN